MLHCTNKGKLPFSKCALKSFSNFCNTHNPHLACILIEFKTFHFKTDDMTDCNTKYVRFIHMNIDQNFLFLGI